MQSTSTAVSAFLPSFSEWQEEVAMERLMIGLVKLVLVAPAVLTAVKLIVLHA